MKLKTLIIFSLLLILVGINVFKISLNFGFSGDDYLALMDYLKGTGSHWFTWKFFFWQYGPTDTIFGTIYRIFGFTDPKYFFAISAFLRILSSLAVFFSIFLLSKDKTTSFIAALLWLVNYSGIETTSWVFNMGSYLSIGLFVSWVLTFINFWKSKNWHLFALSNILFWVTLVAQPIRMTGLPLFALILPLVLINTKSIKKDLGFFVLNTLSIFILVSSIFLVGNSLGTGANFFERIKDAAGVKVAGVQDSIPVLLANRNFKVFLTPVSQMGFALIPDTSIRDGKKTLGEVNFRRRVLDNFVVFTVLSLIFFWCVVPKGKRWLGFGIVVFLGGIWSIFVFNFFKNQLYTVFLFEPLLTQVGGWIILYWLYSFKLNKFIFIFGLWALCAYFFTWNRYPLNIQMSNNRYLITPSLGLILGISLLPTLARNFRAKIILQSLLMILIISHLSATTGYLEAINTNRDKNLMHDIRTKFPSLYQIGLITHPNQPKVFYFKSDKSDLLESSTMFGFPAIMGIQDNDPYFPNLVYTTNKSEVVSDYLTGSGLKRFSWDLKPVPIENIFAYELKDNNLADVTNNLRSELLQLSIDQQK